MIKGDKRIIRGWVIYDCANSVYNLVITATLFPIYWGMMTKQADGSDKIPFLGMELDSNALYDFSISFAYLLIALILPLLSGIADSTGNKKRFMQFFTLLGAMSCSAMYFFREDTLSLGIALVILAVIGYAGSLVFYNAYLPEIAEPKDQDRISAQGYALGYAGSAFLLILSLLVIMIPSLTVDVEASKQALLASDPSLSGESLNNAFKAWHFKLVCPYIFISVGIWWVAFAQITFKRLPNNVYQRKDGKGGALSKGYKEIRKVWQEMKQALVLRRYLYAFFMFNMAVQTVMLVAVLFAKEEIIMHGSTEKGMDGGALLLTVLIMQFLAVAGAYACSWLSKKKGNVNALKVIVFIWMMICVAAYMIENEYPFYGLAAAVGFVMGGVQSLARSTYSKFLPDTQDHASYFSFYDVSEKIGVVIGLFLCGLVTQSAGIRESLLVLVSLFAIGFALLFWIPKHKQAEVE